MKYQFNCSGGLSTSQTLCASDNWVETVMLCVALCIPVIVHFFVDNRTRKSIGKIVLEQNEEDTKVFQLLMVLNMTFRE